MHIPRPASHYPGPPKVTFACRACCSRTGACPGSCPAWGCLGSCCGSPRGLLGSAGGGLGLWGAGGELCGRHKAEQPVLIYQLGAAVFGLQSTGLISRGLGHEIGMGEHGTLKRPPCQQDRCATDLSAAAGNVTVSTCTSWGRWEQGRPSMSSVPRSAHTAFLKLQTLLLALMRPSLWSKLQRHGTREAQELQTLPTADWPVVWLRQWRSDFSRTTPVSHHQAPEPAQKLLGIAPFPNLCLAPSKQTHDLNPACQPARPAPGLSCCACSPGPPPGSWRLDHHARDLLENSYLLSLGFSFLVVLGPLLCIPTTCLPGQHLVGLAAPAVQAHHQEAGAGADAARDAPAVALDEVLRLAPLQRVQHARDDKGPALQAL